MAKYLKCVAVMAQEQSTSPDAGDRRAAMMRGNASVRVSLTGIIVGSILYAACIVVFFAVIKDNDHKN